ncbi:MAG TPA: hypothetical protein VFT49_00695 [Candidatus Saccharimonadales bacterium]|nr:hypothetical protein [Candidatus Saccharimonadales bacterium]
MDAKLADLIIFTIILFSGWIIEGFWFDIKRKKHRLNVKNYLLFLVGPLASTGFAIYKLGSAAVYMFILSVFLGALCEYIVDRSYTVFFGARLWRYYRYSINGDTSYLALPIWGSAGLAALLLARIFLKS